MPQSLNTTFPRHQRDRVEEQIKNKKDNNNKYYILRIGKRKVQGVPQSLAAAHPRHEEEEETDKTKQAQIEQTHEKHQG